MQKPWTGDLDGMIERRVIRVLTVNSKTFYFIDKGTQRGTVVDYFRLFEEELNKKLAAENKLKNKNLKVRVVFIPVRRDQLLPGACRRQGRHRRRQSHDHARSARNWWTSPWPV